MLKLNSSVKFNRDLKRCIKRGYDISLLDRVIETLRIPAPLPLKNRDHSLSGNHAGERECHIAPNWLLVYRVNNDEIYLVRTGSHTEVF